MNRRTLFIAVGAIVIAIRCFVALPQDFTTDEQRSFGEALLDFDPYGHQPPPPAYPVYVAAGKLLNLFVREPLPSLLTLGVLSAVCGFILLSIAFGQLLRSDLFGAGAAFAFDVSPPVRSLCAHPTPEPLACALFAAALLLWVRDRPRASAVLAGLAAGTCPQMAVALLAFVIVATRQWRPILAFFVTLAASFEPVLENVGMDRLDLYLTSLPPRTGSLAGPLRQLCIEPWWRATLLVFALAVAGAILCVVRRVAAATPIAAFTLVHFLFALIGGTRMESVRAFVPTLLGVAFFAAAALSLLRWKSPPSRS